MKKIISGILLLTALIFSLVSCQGEENPNNKADTENTSAAEGRQDREVCDDWKNIEITGEHELNVLFVNVGKADSIIIKLDGRYYMIDTGTSESVPYTLAALDSMGVEKIECVFLTHPDRDHVGGYSYIRERYEVGTVYSSTICGDMYVIEGTAAGDTLVKLDPGEVVSASDGVYFEVLSPIKYNPLDDNDNSLVLRLTVNGVTFLFAGDMKFDEEKTLLNSEMGVECDVLKVGYHGRKDATSIDFLDSAKPKYAVISTSTEEDKDTAHESVLGMLDGIGCEYYITEDFDLGIMMSVSPDGVISVENYETGSVGADIKIDSVSKENQTVTLTNKTGADIDISGWFIVSDRGGEVYCFPERSVVKSGDDFILACKDYNGEADVIWNESKVWHETKSDRASLIDKWGNLIDDKKSK
ncbi:MAG: MBL fold metallo-hydrolase [Eubacteriales bacterium]